MITEVEDRIVWSGAVLTFGIGDLATTYIGLQIDGIYEMSPTATMMLQSGGYSNLIIAKSFALIILIAVYKTVDEDWMVVVPISLILFGVFITLWNLRIIINAI